MADHVQEPETVSEHHEDAAEASPAAQPLLELFTAVFGTEPTEAERRLSSTELFKLIVNRLGPMVTSEEVDIVDMDGILALIPFTTPSDSNQHQFRNFMSRSMIEAIRSMEAVIPDDEEFDFL